QDNSERALKRVQQCSNLDCSGLQQFQDSWKQKYKQALNELDKKKLVFALLTVRKAKSYWENLQPPEDWPRTSQDYRDQLSLKIAEYYSQNIDDHYNHIASFFKSLKEICSITQNR
ncbi:MAG: hypothetical protein SWJ54_14895, partial [Cyanobacteriota bacterium]|nr:hypothetical protein [Cyanobacteriota bacterium]